MKTLYQSLLLMISALALAGTGYAQVPSSNDTSDQYFNTGMGTNALFGLTPASATCAVDNGACNTASGYQALYSNSTGSLNTASGYEALYSNRPGNYNTALGYEALHSNTEGNSNTATGFEALLSNTSGGDNTASGAGALHDNTGGSLNTAAGVNALQDNTTGNYNTAAGAGALLHNTTGNYNTASGYEALSGSTGGVQNTAVGIDALLENKDGGFNTAVGMSALQKSANGKYNVAVGWEAGFALTGGSNNIDIGSPGLGADSAVIRIGSISNTTSTQSAAYIAGVYGVTTGTAGMAVVIDSAGQLGTVSSSIRFKEDIHPMASESERLLKLRPVSFRYKKPDALGEKPVQYGLIAEEVAKVYPELVVRNPATGRIDGVRYDELAPMLLNVVQKQADQLHGVQQQMAEMHAELMKIRTEGSSGTTH